mmetsp:Transcript_24117/g.50903  ORF Transcript_24117/g.50903 Transcript_24117/m.50903 type:complete len:220 (-) Transcript_24117:366-1025(-)
MPLHRSQSTAFPTIKICRGSFTLSETEVPPPEAPSPDERGGMTFGPNTATAHPTLMKFLLFLKLCNASPNKKTETEACTTPPPLTQPIVEWRHVIDEGRSAKLSTAKARPVLELRRDPVSVVRIPHVAILVLPECPPLPVLFLLLPSVRKVFQSAREAAASMEQDLYSKGRKASTISPRDVRRSVIRRPVIGSQVELLILFLRVWLFVSVFEYCVWLDP